MVFLSTFLLLSRENAPSWVWVRICTACDGELHTHIRFNSQIQLFRCAPQGCACSQNSCTNLSAEICVCSQLLVVHFWADWAPQCKQVADILDELAKDDKYRDCKFLKASAVITEWCTFSSFCPWRPTSLARAATDLLGLFGPGAGTLLMLCVSAYVSLCLWCVNWVGGSGGGTFCPVVLVGLLRQVIDTKQ